MSTWVTRGIKGCGGVVMVEVCPAWMFKARFTLENLWGIWESGEGEIK